MVHIKISKDKMLYNNILSLHIQYFKAHQICQMPRSVKNKAAYFKITTCIFVKSFIF